MVSDNVEFLPGQVRTRLGFGVAFDADINMSALYNWISSLGNLLLWYQRSDNSVQLIDISTPVTTQVIPGDLLGVSAYFSEAGARLFCTFYALDSTGASGARVISFVDPSFVQDLAFLPPITYVPSDPSEPGSGSVTAGLHYFGYRIEYRSGFITRPSPDTGNGVPGPATFDPLGFTTAGGANLSWTLNTAWPAGAINVYAIMTPVANPAQFFFVPGAVEPVVGGTTMSITFDIDISDDLLFSTGVDVTNSIFFLTNTVTNVPPFFPSTVFTHGNRMCYVTTVSDSNGNQTGAIYASNRGAYQEIAPDLSLIQLPGFKNIIAAISLDNVMYIFGPQWTYRTIDNGSDPDTWPTPGLVDARRGTLSVKGAVVSPAGTYAWVGVPGDGLYFFQGVFPSLPVSYYQSDVWSRINWDVPQTFDIKDDPQVKNVYVMVALDGATTPSHLLRWDYTNGFSPEAVNFSMDFIQNYNIGCMEVVRNTLTGMPDGVPQKKELWVGPSDAAPILRRKSVEDDDPYLDNDFPIFANWESSLFPRQGTRGEVYQHAGGEYRIKGDGKTDITIYTLDHSQSFECLQVDLEEAPGKIIHRSFSLISEGVSHLITQGKNLIENSSFET